jgi:DOPA 4,5-dioxygenase
MCQLAFAGDQFAAVVPWLMLNRGGLSILVHLVTDDPVADHEVNPRGWVRRWRSTSSSSEGW